MKRLSLWLALTLSCVLPQSILAQAPEDQMAEDIEILRRLLGKELLRRPSLQCAACHDAGWGAMFSTYDQGKAHIFSLPLERIDHHPAVGHASVSEGIYLKGYGVVYAVTLPPGPHEEILVQAKPKMKPLSDWERIRKELHGEFLDLSAEVGLARLPSLTDTILHVLAENGRHFSRLGKDEKLTVAVTFRPPEAPPAKTETLSKQAKDFELQGDLHLRQGDLKEAVAAYEKGLKASPSPAAKKTFYRKLAQAYFQFEDPRSIEYMKKYEEAKTAPPPAPARPWPKRLIVSASKELLDRVGANSITFDDFHRAATVEQQPPLVKEKKEDKQE